MKTITAVIGTRPEAIKLAPVILALRRGGGATCRVWVTAQHREMLDPMLEAFELAPDVDLGLMRPAQSLASFTSRAIESLDRSIEAERPHLMLVQGDTTTTLCAALAAFYRRVPVGHVEAGLRTGDLSAPWPEEANRSMVARLASLHFAPTTAARENLLREGIDEGAIHVTGNTVVDAVLLALERVKARPPEVPGIAREELAREDDAPLVLITGHRRESFGPGLEAICRAIETLARRRPRALFVYPVHLNPSVSGPVRRMLGDGLPNVRLIEPVAYLPFVELMRRARLILTDSGGIQEEAPSLGKPVLVMREKTERPEAVVAGTAVVVGTSTETIVAQTERLLDDRTAYTRMARAPNPFGDGRAAGRIARLCLDRLGSSHQE